MKDENGRNTLLTQLKGKQAGIFLAALIGAVAPAWFGTINSYNQDDNVDQAHEKANVSYEILSGAFKVEKEAVWKSIDQQAARLDRLEAKIDKLLMSATGEPIPPPPPPPSEPKPKPNEDLELPKTLDLAMEQKAAL